MLRVALCACAISGSFIRLPCVSGTSPLTGDLMTLRILLYICTFCLGMAPAAPPTGAAATRSMGREVVGAKPPSSEEGAAEEEEEEESLEELEESEGLRLEALLCSRRPLGAALLRSLLALLHATVAVCVAAVAAGHTAALARIMVYIRAGVLLDRKGATTTQQTKTMRPNAHRSGDTRSRRHSLFLCFVQSLGLLASAAHPREGRVTSSAIQGGRPRDLSPATAVDSHSHSAHSVRHVGRHSSGLRRHFVGHD